MGRMLMWLIGPAIAVMLVMAACDGDSGPAERTPGATPTDGDGEITLIVAIPAMPVGIDKDLSAGNPQTWEAIGNCYDTGLAFKVIPYPFDEPPEGSDALYLDLSEHEPWQLESAELSPDGASVTLNIRPGVLGPTGNELTADDVAWTLDRAIGLQAIGYFYNLLIDLDESNPYEIIDDYTIRVNATGPNGQLATVWDDLYYGFIDSEIAQEHATADDPWATEWLATNCAGFGAYTVESWVPGREIIWTANPNYFQGKPQIDRVVYRLVPESSVRLSSLQRGDVDIAQGLTPDHWRQASGSDGVNAYAVRSGFIHLAYMNSLFEPFDDVRVRQAFNYVMPRREIAEQVFLGLAVPWQTAYPTINPGANPDLWPYGEEPDFDAARDLLADAGHADGLNVELSYSTADPLNEQMATAIRTNLAQIGVEVTLNPLPDGDFADRSYGRSLPFGVWIDTPGGGDPIYNLSLYYFDPESVGNFGQIDDAEIQERISSARQLLTLEERIEASQPIQERVLELAPFANLVEPFYTVAMRDNIEGFTWNNFQNILFRQLTKR